MDGWLATIPAILSCIIDLEGNKRTMNKLYSVQYLNFSTSSCTIVGLFRDENTAIMFQNDKNGELKTKDGNSVPKGNYVVMPLYTDF